MLVRDSLSVVSNTNFPTDWLRSNAVSLTFRSPPAVVVGGRVDGVGGVGGGKGQFFLFILSNIAVPYCNARESQAEHKKYVSTLKNITFGPVGGLLSS